MLRFNCYFACFLFFYYLAEIISFHSNYILTNYFKNLGMRKCMREESNIVHVTSILKNYFNCTSSRVTIESITAKDKIAVLSILFLYYLFCQLTVMHRDNLYTSIRSL